MRKKTATERLTGLLFKLHVDKQGVHSFMVGCQEQVFEKPSKETKLDFVRRSDIVNIAIFNVKTLKTPNQFPELTKSTAEKNIDIICVQKHRY